MGIIRNLLALIGLLTIIGGGYAYSTYKPMYDEYQPMMDKVQTIGPEKLKKMMVMVDEIGIDPMMGMMEKWEERKEETKHPNLGWWKMECSFIMGHTFHVANNLPLIDTLWNERCLGGSYEKGIFRIVRDRQRPKVRILFSESESGKPTSW